MSSALTFYFKEIFQKAKDFTDYITEYEIADLTEEKNLTFATYLYKILFRRFHNSNVQYDTPEDFKCDLANILEDSFNKYQKQLEQIDKVYQLTADELQTINTAIANQSLNPNTKVEDPTQPIDYISAQAFTIARDNKLQAYLRAIANIPTKLIDSMLLRCVNLFKTILPRQVFVYGEKE